MASEANDILRLATLLLLSDQELCGNSTGKNPSLWNVNHIPYLKVINRIINPFKPLKSNRDLSITDQQLIWWVLKVAKLVLSLTNEFL